MICPVCKRGMVALELEKIDIDHCLSCGGIWLDAGELELLLEGFEGKDTLLSSFESEEVGERTGQDRGGSRERGRRCPICLKRMEKILCGMDEKKIRIDKCKRNDGYWFDKGELEAAIRIGSCGKESIVLGLLRGIFAAKV
ncbi:MAG: zf-TFIIB domain-containing protein [Acidobacteriota bacterium]